MFVLSKIKQVMGHGSSGDNNTEGEAAKSDEECKGKPKGDVEELLEQCSQFEEMDTQDFSDSPILFPSQTSDDKKKNEEEDSDCYEIVDKIVKGSEKEKHSKGLNNKSCLSLGRKRQVCEKSGECSARDSNSSKQRRVEDEDNDPYNTTTSHKERCLFRVYKKPVCEDIEEADRRNLFYAPRHVKPALYTPTIVRKLETYRWRLRHAQSSLRSYVFPLHSKAIDPILARSRGRMGGRIKRVSVMKKCTPDYKKWAEGKRNIDPFVAALYDILVSKEEGHNAASSNEALDKQETNTNDGDDDDVVCTKVSHSSRNASKIAKTTEFSTSGTSQHTDAINDNATVPLTVLDVVMETENCDVPVKSLDNDVEAVNSTVHKETVKNGVAGNVKNAVVVEALNNETSSPVKQVLPEARRKIVSEEGNSDDDFEKFNFQPSVEENKIEEEDCVVVETETSHQDKLDHIECPMCYKKFPQDTVQQHAFHCNGLDETSTSSVRTDVQNGEMSPVIKTRTPTKVKELKLLAKVEMKANEFGVERKVKNETNTKKSHKRVSLEPSIKLAHFDTKWMKCGESMTKGKQTVIKENEKNTSTLRQNKQPSQQKRLSVSNARKNLERRSWTNVASLKKDFIPLEFVEQKENEKIPSKDVHKLLSLVDINSTDSSSDEESHETKLNTSQRKSVEADDDMSALSTMAADYRKRKRNRNVNKNPKKIKVCDENATEHCYVCGKDIPRLQFNEHVNEEIERQRKQDEEKDFNLSVMSSLSQTLDGASIENTTTARISVSLPDLAEGTTWQTNNELDKEEKVNNKQFSVQSTQNKRCSGRERRSSLRKT